MTEDAKNNILKYLTNNAESFNPLTPTYALQNINETGTNTGNFNTATFTVSEIMGLIQAKDIINDIDLVIYYGYGVDNHSHTIGCLIYCDKEGNFLQLITKFSSGSDLFCIYDLKTNEEGQMYAIGYDAQEADGAIHTRLLLLENIAQYNQLTNQYEAKLRISYRLQGSNYNDNSGGAVQHPESTKVIKDNNSASYLIYYRYINLFYMLRFKIVFGGSNEWEDYSTNANYLRSRISVEWDEENPLITILEQDATVKEYINKYYIVSSSSTTTTQIDFTSDIQDLMEAYFSSNYTVKRSTIAMVNSSFAYVTFSATVSYGGLYGLVVATFRLDYSDSKITRIYYASFDSLQDDFTSLNCIVNNNTELVYATFNDTSYFENLVLYINNHDRGYTVYHDVIDYGNHNYKYFPILYNVYNLANISVLIYDGTNDANVTSTWSFLYAEDTYVGDYYYSKNSLLADKVSLYDSNDLLIFDRDISNLVVQGSTITTSVNIPNIYLNTSSIEKEELLSKNNNIIVSDSTSITKNIYEDLYINFINTITMQDRNTANYVTNQNGANRLANSAFYTVDYADAVMTKYRINYSDNSTYVGNILNSQINYGTKEATYNFAIYVSQAADSLQLISNDENTVFQTIDISNLSVGLYSISQHVYIQ